MNYINYKNLHELICITILFFCHNDNQNNIFKQFNYLHININR